VFLPVTVEPGTGTAFVTLEEVTSVLVAEAEVVSEVLAWEEVTGLVLAVDVVAGTAAKLLDMGVPD
jgi:hypothetical protein